MTESWVTVSITQKMYGWTKWGGAREGMLKEDLDVWYCQSCGKQEVKILPCYMLPMDSTEREFIRICSICKAKAIVKKLSIWTQLKTLK